MNNNLHVLPLCQWYKPRDNEDNPCALGRNFYDNSYCPIRCPEYLAVDTQGFTDEVTLAILTIIGENDIISCEELCIEFMKRYPDLASKMTKRLEP